MVYGAAAIVSALTLIGGLLSSNGPLWIPATVLAAAVIATLTVPWALSGKRGANALLSESLRAVSLLSGLYAAVGMFVCAGLAARWVFW